MSVAKIIEITAESNESFEKATQAGIDKASKTVKQIRSAWIKDQEVIVKGNSIVSYRVHLKLTFMLD